MAEMELIDDQGKLYPNASTRVMAYMLFPHDEERWIDYLALERLRTLANEDRDVKGRIALRGTEFGGTPEMDRRIGAEKKFRNKAFSEGQTSGGLLIFIWRCAKHAPSHASLIRAQAFAMNHLVNPPRTGGVSFDYIRGAWRKYKNVAHLWAATTPDYFEEGPTPENLPQFLGIADYFARFGTPHKHSNRYDANHDPTLLDEASLIKIPGSVAHKVETIEPPEMVDVELAHLEEHKRKGLGRSKKVEGG